MVDDPTEPPQRDTASAQPVDADGYDDHDRYLMDDDRNQGNPNYPD